MWIQAGAWCFGALLSVKEVVATTLVHHVSPVRHVQVIKFELCEKFFALACLCYKVLFCII